MIDHNLYIDLLSGYIMTNTENPTRPNIIGEPAGRVSIQTGETNMTNTTEKARIWSSKKVFIRFLEDTLIPDLKESGMEFTAEDFETAVYYMKGGK